MKRMLALAGAILGLVTANAAAQNAPSFWDGVAVIDFVNPTCRQAGTAAGNVAVGSLFTSSYRARLDPQEPSSGITFVASRSMQIYFNNSNPANGDTANDQMRGVGTYALRILRGNVTRDFNGNSFPGKFNFKIKPAVITAGTDAIDIDGTIFNWRGVTGCTVKFRGAYRANPLNAAP